ncbi:hypothetical protein FALCPG4_003253 [Fusarium falciforme]
MNTLITECSHPSLSFFVANGKCTPLLVGSRGSIERGTSQAQEGEDGEVELIKANIFRDFLKYFRDNNRVIVAHNSQNGDVANGDWTHSGYQGFLGASVGGRWW